MKRFGFKPREDHRGANTGAKAGMRVADFVLKYGISELGFKL